MVFCAFFRGGGWIQMKLWFYSKPAEDCRFPICTQNVRARNFYSGNVKQLATGFILSDIEMPGSHQGRKSPDFTWDSPPTSKLPPLEKVCSHCTWHPPKKGTSLHDLRAVMTPLEVTSSWCDVAHDALSPSGKLYGINHRVRLSS